MRPSFLVLLLLLRCSLGVEPFFRSAFLPSQQYHRRSTFRASSTTTTTTTSSWSSSSFIEVFDGVLDRSTSSSLLFLLERLDDETNMAEATRVIDRQKKTVEPLLDASPSISPTEAAIEGLLRSVVDEIGDGSRFIEWWWRDEWLPFEAHRDVSEGEAESLRAARELRCPNFGHVMYLDIGEGVRGPTCVFQDGQRYQEPLEFFHEAQD